MDIEPDEFEPGHRVNYHGFVHGTRVALRRMLPRDRGTVVQVGSTLAYRGIPLQSAYCGSKHAIQGFHESLRTELLPRRQQRARDDGAAAGAEHASVLVGAVAVATPGAAGTADLPAGGRGPDDRLGGRAPEAARVLVWRDDGRHPARERRRSGHPRPVPGPYRSGCPTDRRTARSRAAGATCGSLPTDDRRDFGTHGGFDDRSRSRVATGVGVAPPRHRRLRHRDGRKPGGACAAWPVVRADRRRRRADHRDKRPVVEDRRRLLPGRPDVHGLGRRRDGRPARARRARSTTSPTSA